MLAAMAFLFLDFGHAVPPSWFHTLTWLQFVPSLFQFFHTLGQGLAVSAYGFVVIGVLSLLFGRVYCSFLCPLGILKDLLAWFSAKVRPKKLRLRFVPPHTKLRYGLLLLVCLSLFSGSLFLLNLLEPFGNFGRFFSDLFRPAYMLSNNLLARLFEALGSYALYPVAIAKTNPYALLIPVGMLALVVSLAVKRGRLYCNTVCPVGTLLGLFSKVALYQIRFDVEGCNQCGDCVFSCKAQCIELKNKKVDFSRCVACGNCLRACSKNGIRYSFAFAPRPKKAKEKAAPKAASAPPALTQATSAQPMSAKQASAQQALTQQALTQHSPGAEGVPRRFVLSALSMAALGGLSKACAQSCGRKKGEACETGCGNVAFVATRAATPPGSLGWKHFSAACTACHLCVSACPSGVLKPSFLEYGFGGMMQPFMDFGAGFCNYECTRCTEVCPTGALLPLTVEKKLSTQIGIVRFERENCVVVTEGTSCGACSELCPTQAVRMVPYEGALTLPELNTDICIGCGACEYACPTIPYKAIVVDGLLEHQKAEKPKTEKLETKPLEDFPF